MSGYFSDLSKAAPLTNGGAGFKPPGLVLIHSIVPFTNMGRGPSVPQALC